MDDRQEFRLRRKAIRLRLQGTPHKVILAKVHRSRAWLSKWQTRFDHRGMAGLRSRSRRPRHTPRACAPRIMRLIVQTRRRLVKQTVGLLGPRAIWRELRPLGLGKHLPSLATIKRVLQTHGLVSTPPAAAPAYFPKPLTTREGTLQAVDWTCRYLEGGLKVYAFHTLNLRTRTCSQTIAADKSGATVLAHGVATWKTLGIPQFLQLDNDAAFCGGYKTPRLFGQFVRLCLYLGIELIFLPVAEPKRNGEVEEVNGLWAHAFWERRRFTSFGQVCRASPAFLHWYMTEYTPPVLAGLTPRQAQRREPRWRLTATHVAHLPAQLPITAGRIHFIRQVKSDGTIAVLNERWPVSRRLAGQYVWATIITHCRQLEIWYQRSAQHDWRLLRAYAYNIPETVARLRPEFTRPKTAWHSSRCPEPSPK
jgi:putative transposase